MTSTQDFGSGARENHDSSSFYARFQQPKFSRDKTVDPAEGVESPLLVHGDSRHMVALPDNSVALVVTSPPYYVGKVYEDVPGSPASYGEYLELLHDVFAECLRVLEPGGRMAVNVANLGRKPFRSLSADVTAILQDRLKMWLRGEIVWVKGKGNSGSAAWGSWRSASNPVMRDLTERIVVASKGRMDRAPKPAERAKRGLPHESTISAEDFMAWTLDVWVIPPASARRTGHPAPFPVELPHRLIQFHTYSGDLVLDPFMGSGSTLLAAVSSGRRAAGYDTDEAYVALARRRLASVAQDGGQSV